VLVMLSIVSLAPSIAASAVPPLNRNCESLFEVRRAKGKVLLRKDMAPSLEGHSDPGTYVLGVLPGPPDVAVGVLACLGVHSRAYIIQFKLYYTVQPLL
jgi:hypothetical protein